MNHSNPKISRCALAGMVATLLFLLAGLAGCGDDGEGLVNPLETDGSVLIEISRSTTPEFDWTSGVAIQAISVYNFGSTGQPDQLLWGYANVSVTPPVRYGTNLAGTNLTGRETVPPLQSGNRYRVEVARADEASYANWIVP